MFLLPNDCKWSGFHVFPPNWKTSKAKRSINWYADYNFIDPQHFDKYPKGKSIRLKRGINQFKTLEERRVAIDKLLEETEVLLKNGYNPITEKLVKLNKPDKSVPEYSNNAEILPITPFIQAFRIALDNSTNVKECIADMRSVVNSIESAATKLSYLNIPIGEIEVKHIKRCLDLCHKTNPKFSAKRYNKAKAYLSSLFRYLIQEGATQGNMARAVNPMKEETTRILYFKDDEIERIKNHLWTYNRPFYNFMMMFYFSGGRIKEFMRLKGRDVDMVEQTYTTIVKKGKSRWVSRTIRNVAISFWKEQLKDCGPDDFVFSINLLPGATEINSKQVTRRWRTHVQIPLGIETTFYKLKHLNTDRTLKAVGAKMAAGQNAHVSTKMVEQVYAYNEKKRIHESLKELDIQL